MKGFQKLAIASAILAASGSALALEAMDDASLSATTGQDGITINVSNSTITDLDVTWVDRGGFAAPFNADGALVINNVDLTINDLDIVVDAGNSGADGAQLNIAISTTQDVVVGLDNTTIEVAAGGVGSLTSGNTEIIAFNAGSSLTITGGINANIKLGNRAAGENFMTLSNTTPFDVVLTGLTILDSEATAANGSVNTGIGIGTLTVNDVVLNNAINVVPAGLTINTAGTTIGEVAMENVVLGDQVANAAAPIGDLYLNNLSASTTLTISGH